MLTDVALKNLRPKTKPYKVADRDGMYAHVSPGGSISFRLDYRLNNRRETVCASQRAGLHLRTRVIAGEEALGGFRRSRGCP
jgi:hypothetical protein